MVGAVHQNLRRGDLRQEVGNNGEHRGYLGGLEFHNRARGLYIVFLKGQICIVSEPTSAPSRQKGQRRLLQMRSQRESGALIGGGAAAIYR